MDWCVDAFESLAEDMMTNKSLSGRFVVTAMGVAKAKLIALMVAAQEARSREEE